MLREFTQVSRPAESVALLTFGTENDLNPLSIGRVAEIVEVLFELEREDTVRAVVLTGGQRAFAAGADIGEMVDVTVAEMKTRNQFRDWDRLRTFSKPLIAAVRGYALGGGLELALSCDLVVAGESARFGFPEVNLGLMPGAGGTQRLARKVGTSRALEMLWLGKPVDSKRALDMGLVEHVVADEETVHVAIEWAVHVAKQAPLSVRAIKEAVYQATDVPLGVGMEAERNLFYLLFATDDKAEGVQAFLEKRPPRFEGR